MKSIRGARIYTMDGEITEDPTLFFDGKDFFRKMTTNKKEKEICTLLMKHPHNNIITIYDIGNNYIDMEFVHTDIHIEDRSKLHYVMMEVKTYLQEIGIIYIDWKVDNIGISNDGTYKLFDFDCSGVMDIETKQWIITPPTCWSYHDAIQHGMDTPVDIDNYAFKEGI